MSDTLMVAVREGLGTRDARRLRAAGKVPANLYGHGHQNVYLAVPAEQVEAVVRHGGKVVNLKGAVEDTALIREVCWDTYGTHVLHLDLARVSASETVQVTVSIELRGQAPGLREGGMVEQFLREVEIRCPVASIPERFEVSLVNLHLNQSISCRDLVLPPNAEWVTDVGTMVAHCVPAKAFELAEAGPVEAAAEPELIGRKPAEEETEE